MCYDYIYMYSVFLLAKTQKKEGNPLCRKLLKHLHQRDATFLVALTTHLFFVNKISCTKKTIRFDSIPVLLDWYYLASLHSETKAIFEKKLYYCTSKKSCSF